MAIIPLPQTAVISPLTGYDPDYNEPTYGDDYELRCRFQEGTKLVRDRNGEEVVSVGEFLFDGLATVTINDKLTYTNELGAATTYTPIAISVKRAINGKPILTEVNV
ncbi:hypothetical protein [Paenibacillus durus]|uniref:Uncharacterized protein n=1 Tax=Paenibacillus durus TaxID=44251 RepID=A0A089HRB3_PAEDU|nr:hypothetical protein [Paenibacillus durus]AIQ13632.1 hypothetical protein PDUR_18200 [Paenibacillus durus]